MLSTWSFHCLREFVYTWIVSSQCMQLQFFPYQLTPRSPLLNLLKQMVYHTAVYKVIFGSKIEKSARSIVEETQYISKKLTACVLRHKMAM